MYSPTTSRVFSMKSGSVENLNDSLRCGWSPNVRHIREMVACDSPVSVAISRVLQCVAPFGREVSVLAMISSTRSSPTFLGGPERGASVRPRTRSSRKRSRHLPTVTNEIPRSSATSTFVRPSAHLRMIFARKARACADLRRRTSRSNSACSLSESANFRRGLPAMSLRIRQPPVLCNELTTQDTTTTRKFLSDPIRPAGNPISNIKLGLARSAMSTTAKSA